MAENGAIDFEAMGKLLEFQLENGTDAIVVNGTTGESSTLQDEEKYKLIEFTVKRVHGRVPVIAGAGSNNTAHAVELSKKAQELGADGLLEVTPYYNKTSQRGLVAHYTAVADAVDLPILLYNVPSRTGVDIKPETVAALSKHPNIVAVKEANGNISSAAQVAALCDIDIYSGNDDQIVPLLSLGGKGVISVMANVEPRRTHDIVAKWMAGDVEGSRALQLELLELASAMFMDVNPIPVKEAMNLMGLDVGECRLPLYGMDDAAKSKLASVLRKYRLMK